MPRREKGRDRGREKAREALAKEPRRRRGRYLAGEDNLPKYTPDIALRSIDGHLTRTGTQVMAWYRLAAQAWSFRSDSQREVLIRQIAAQLGELQGRWLHIRVTTRPYPVHMWAESFDNNALGRLPDVPGALGWDGFLEGEQRHLMGLSMSDKEVFLGIEVSGRSMLDRWVEKAAPVLGKVAPAAARAELSALHSEVGHLDELVAGSGLDAVPASTDDIAWLMYRSCALGLPAPRTISPSTASRWDTEDLAAFTDGVDMFQEPYAPTVRVVGRLRSATVQRNVAVLTLGLMDGLRIPEVDDPWMQHSDRLPFPVEWSARIYVRRPEEVTGELQRQMGKVRSQIRHYTHDHDLDPPMSLSRQADRVLEVEDELTSGLTQMNTRLYGWWRIAVAGKDESEAVSRAQQVLEVYRPKVQVEHPEAQYRFAREFIPGEPLASTAYRRRGSVMWAAAAVPAATASVGDRRGIMLGETCTATRRPVAWDPWLAQEVRRASGLTAVVGGLGSGKSFLTGLVVYKSLRAGARWTVLDPSGPLAEMTRLPELAPFSRHINLLRAEPGILNPYRVVAEPRREHFNDDEEPERSWRRERSLAAATRRRLVLDVLTGLLPYDVARIPHTRIVLLRAVREVGGAADRHPGQVIDTLRRHQRDGEQHAGVVADFLEERRELPQAALLFPDTSRHDPWQADREYRLTVLTMQGMTLPRPGSPREEWTDGESLAVELLNLASWLTQRTIYDANRNLRKGVALDETHFLSQVPTGKVLIDRLARDSRKFNVRALFASQLAGDLLRVSGFASLVNAVFVGRTDDEEAQAEALRLLRVPTGVGYEQMLGTLSPRPRHDDRPDDTPRQFVFADGHGGVEKIRIDLEAPHLEHVREALDTNPDANRISTRGAPAGAAALRAPDEPGPAAAGALDEPNAPARPIVEVRNGAAPQVVPANGTELFDDEELDLFDDLDEVPATGDDAGAGGTGPVGSARVPGVGTGCPAGPFGDTPGPAGGTQLPAMLVLAAAVLTALLGPVVRARRRRAAGSATGRRRGVALLVVTGLVGASVLLGSPAFGQSLDCKEAPEPDRPGTGLVGSLDPPTYGIGEPGSVYYEVGYSGMVWHNYDLGCAGTAFNPSSTTDTWLGNQAFNVAKFAVGGVNWAHYLIAGGGDLLAPLDGVIRAATTAMYQAVFTTWIGPALVVLSVTLLVLALRGDLAQQAQRVAFALAALLVGSAAYLTPVEWAKAADGLLLDGITQMQEGFLSQVGLGDRDTLPTVLVDRVVYDNWVRGEFGSPDVPQAQQFGRDLLRAQTFTKAEVAQGHDTADLAQQKKAAFVALAGQMGDRYTYFQGKSGSRVGVGILAVFEAACVALFQLLSKVLVLTALLLLRLMVMTAPAIAVVALLKPEILPALLRVAGAAIVNTIVVGALAGLHALLVVTMFRPGSGIDLWLALLVTGVVTVVLWAVARPFRRLVSMVSLTNEQFGGIVPGAGSGPMSRVWRRVRGASDDDRQSRWWEERRSAAEGFAGYSAPRPEAEPVIATAYPAGAGPRAPQRRTEVEPVGSAPIPAARRPALPGGPDPTGAASFRPSWVDPNEVDERVIYRRPDAVPLRPGGARPVAPEIVEGTPVYRIYRPGRTRPAYSGGD